MINLLHCNLRLTAKFRGNFFHKLGRKTAKDIEGRIELISQGFELFNLSKYLNYMTNCLRHYKLCLDDLPTLELKILELQEGIGEIHLSSVPVWLTEIKVLLADLTSVHLQYFAKVQEAFEVVDFLRRVQDFRRQVDLLSGQLQGYQFGLDMLNNVIAVREILEPFLVNVSTPQRPCPITLPEFCVQVYEKLARFNDSELTRRLDKISNVLKCLAEIRVWFSHSEGLTLGTVYIGFDFSRLIISFRYDTPFCVYVAEN